MNYRILGRTGIRVSEVAFGGVEIGMPYANHPMPAESDSVRLLHSAIDQGINFFDTARSYGKSEAIMGRAFKGRREQVVIATKLAHILDQQGNLPDHRILRETVESSLEESLTTLDMEYVDIFMLHQGTQEILESDAVAEVFSDLKRIGKVKAIGVSTYDSSETELAIDRAIWDVIQLPFNLMDQKQQSLFGKAHLNQVGIVVRSVLFRGMLSGTSMKLHSELKKVEEHIASFNDFLEEGSPDLPTLATKFALSFDEVSSVLIGIDRMEYLDSAIKYADASYLGGDVLDKLVKKRFPDPDFLNLHTWVSKGWIK